MRRAHAFLGLALVLLLLGFSFNAYACLVPLYGGASAAKGSDCSAPEEQSARQFCDTFKTFGVHTLPDLQPATDTLAFCPENTASLSLLLNLHAPGIPAAGYLGDGSPQDLLVKSSVLRL